MILFSYDPDEPHLCLYIAYKEQGRKYYTVQYFSDLWGDWILSSYFNMRYTNKKKLRQFLLGLDNIEIYHFS
jgi:hypothetical protein